VDPDFYFSCDAEGKLSTDLTDAVFVYGTLMRGQCRASFWPVSPLSVCEGWVRGSLYGRPDYPAMTAGQERVNGELWRFSVDQMPVVIERLDEIEGTNQANQPDLYLRVVVEVFGSDDGSQGKAFAYHYATDPLRDGFQRIGPSWP
jgi:gamma-glutamylcyclotransferase (GGCT)/AIG2-like uncharacterized protein YtfP